MNDRTKQNRKTNKFNCVHFGKSPKNRNRKQIDQRTVLKTAPDLQKIKVQIQSLEKSPNDSLKNVELFPDCKTCRNYNRSIIRFHIRFNNCKSRKLNSF